MTEEDGSQVTAAPTGEGTFNVPLWADSSLVQNSDGTYTFVRHQTETETFSAGGQLLSPDPPIGLGATAFANDV